MANRKNSFLLKRSNVSGKIPVEGDLLLGEIALNTADVILYTSGTTSNSILPIGWDRIHRTGDTMTGNFIISGDLSVSGTSTFNNEVQLKSVVRNTAGRIVFGTSLDPETDRSQTLGSSTKSWGNVFSQFFTIEDDSGADQVIIKSVNQTVVGDVAWAWELPATGGTSGSIMGITSHGSGDGASFSSTWYSLSGINIDINIDSGGTITFSGASISGTGTDNYITGGTLTSGGTLTLTRNDDVDINVNLTGTKRLTLSSREGNPISAGEAFLGTSGAAFFSFLGTGTADDDASWNFTVPSDYISGGTFYIKFVTNTTTDSVQFEMNITSRDNGGDMSTPTDTAIQNATQGSSTDWFMVETSAYTPSSSTFASNKNVVVRINRDASDAPDTYNGTAYVWGLVFEYTGIK